MTVFALPSNSNMLALINDPATDISNIKWVLLHAQVLCQHVTTYCGNIA
jgi:hypothetical protein